MAGLVLVLLVLAGPARAAWMIPPSPYRAKDFSVVKRDGWYHCFYIRRDASVPIDSTERDLGHAISRDLYLWNQLPPVLEVRPDHWDNARIWAPDIKEIDGVYYMFYTGVTIQPGTYAFYQQIGLATSTDLLTWNRYDEPVFSCDRVRWASCDPLSFSGGEFRDAFVMRDPASNGWLMYYTARPVSSPNTYIAGMASSDGNLMEWVNREPLWITHTTYSGSSLVESPHVFHHNGLYYLVFTGNGSAPLRLATGTDPAGPLSTWTYRGPLGPIIGNNTTEWYASEYFQDGTHDYFAFINYDRVDFREMIWTDWKFHLLQPPLFHVQRLLWDTTQVVDGQAARLRIEAVNTIGQSAKIEAVEVDADGSEELLPSAMIGLPDSIPLTGPTTDYWWTAHTWPDSGDTDPDAEIVVRMTDHTATSAVLVVSPSLWRSVESLGPGDASPRVPRELGTFRQRGAGPGFRTLRDSPLGRTALLVDLEGPSASRLEVFDLAGRRVRMLADRDLPAGATVIAWDGREENGSLARRGVYFARLTTPGFQRTIRVLHTP